MRIERIEPSKHKKGRILVFLEDGACLKITEQELLDFSLHAGDVLEEDALKCLKEAAGISNIRAKAAELISRRALSRRELERKLREKGASAEEAEDAAAWLVSIGALDDAAYAAAVVRRGIEKGDGPARIRAKLHEKGVPRELWEEAMAALPPDSDQIAAFLSRKLRGQIPDETEKRRLTAALLRRGFSWEEIRSAWNQREEEEEAFPAYYSAN